MARRLVVEVLNLVKLTEGSLAALAIPQSLGPASRGAVAYSQTLIHPVMGHPRCTFGFSSHCIFHQLRKS
jgi:hypothetical protein